jgi:hypothetical protein
MRTREYKQRIEGPLSVVHDIVSVCSCVNDKIATYNSPRLLLLLKNQFSDKKYIDGNSYSKPEVDLVERTVILLNDVFCWD